ncbi:MAG: acetylxylan esterase [Bacillota bacterium]|nr:acetylxylan esterase [Bacillota bacterium]
MAQLYDMPLEELKAYKPELTMQEDFDAFWKESLYLLSTIPVEYKLELYNYPSKGVRVYRVSFPGFMGANMDGWLAMPDAQGVYPGLVLFHGYNWAYEGNIHDTVNWALKGYAAFQVLVRGQQGESVDNVVSSHGFNQGWMSKGILSPEEYYYRAVYMDSVRAVEVLASMPEVDSSHIGVTGGSQGGALTLAAAAFSDIPVVAAAHHPFLSNFERAIDISPVFPYMELNEYFRRNSNPEIEEQAKKTLSYFDIMNLAPKIKCHTWICIGLVDEITPPSTVFAVYNHLECSREIAVFRYFGHEYIPGSVEAQLRTLMEHLQPQGK